MEAAFRVETIKNGIGDAFAFHGNIDAHAEPDIMRIPELITSNSVEFDFSRTGRINSMGIAFLLRCMKNIKSDKKAEIRVSGLTPMNTMLFKMTGVFLLARPE